MSQAAWLHHPDQLLRVQLQNKLWRRKADEDRGPLRLHDRAAGHRQQWTSVRRRERPETEGDLARLSLYPQTVSTMTTLIRQLSAGWRPLTTHRNIQRASPDPQVCVSVPARICCLKSHQLHSINRQFIVVLLLCSLAQQVDCQLLSVGSVTGSSLPAACGTPSTSVLRTPSTSLTMSRTRRRNRPFYSTRTSSDWSGSSWIGTLDYRSLSVRNATRSSTSATASWSGFCRESTCRLLGRRTSKAGESKNKIFKIHFHQFVPVLIVH